MSHIKTPSISLRIQVTRSPLRSTLNFMKSITIEQYKWKDEEIPCP